MTRDRIRYDRNETYETLVDEHEVFDSYVDFFMFCATVGVARGRKHPEAYVGGDNELLGTYVTRNELFDALSKAIAYRESGSPEVLNDQSRQLELLAEYAAAGAEVVAEEVTATADDIVPAIARFVLEERARMDDALLSEVGPRSGADTSPS
jgi:dnd system-associated protein 4